MLAEGGKIRRIEQIPRHRLSHLPYDQVLSGRREATRLKGGTPFVVVRVGLRAKFLSTQVV